MKNIHNILKDFGITIPEDKKSQFDKAVEENYKTVSELDGVKNKLATMTQERDNLNTKYNTDIAQRDDDLKKLQKQIEEAGTDAEKLRNTISELDTLKKNYDEDKQKYETQLAKQRYEFAIKEKAGALKFTSNAAKKSFISDAIATELKMDGDTLLGFDDFVDKYRKEDAGVFVTDGTSSGDDKKDKKGLPQFVNKTDNKQDNGSQKKDEPKKRPVIW